MRKIYEFTYNNGKETLRYWDILWEQYTRFFDDPEWVTQELLSEFQELPKLTSDEVQTWRMEAFELMTWERAEKSKADEDIRVPEFHIAMGHIMRQLHQPYSEIMKMPARIVFAFLADMEIFVAGKEYDPNRKSTKPDKKWLKEVLGTTNGTIK